MALSAVELRFQGTSGLVRVPETMHQAAKCVLASVSVRPAHVSLACSPQLSIPPMFVTPISSMSGSARCSASEADRGKSERESERQREEWLTCPAARA